MNTAIQQIGQKHTPGPWNYENGWLYRRGVSPTGIGYTDTVLKIDDAAFEPSEADARLIVAAPDMLAAGKRVLNYATLDTVLADYTRDENMVFGIRVSDLRALASAIAKAEGR